MTGGKFSINYLNTNLSACQFEYHCVSSSLKGTSVKIAINSAITLEMGSYTYPELSSLLSVENLAENYFVSCSLVSVSG